MGWLLSLSPTPSPNKESSVCMGRLFGWLEALLILSYWWSIHCVPGTGQERQSNPLLPPRSKVLSGEGFRNEGTVEWTAGYASEGRLLNSTQGYARQRRPWWGDMIPGCPAQKAGSPLLRKALQPLCQNRALFSCLSMSNLLW